MVGEMLASSTHFLRFSQYISLIAGLYCMILVMLLFFSTNCLMMDCRKVSRGPRASQRPGVALGCEIPQSTISVNAQEKHEARRRGGHSPAAGLLWEA